MLILILIWSGFLKKPRKTSPKEHSKTEEKGLKIKFKKGIIKCYTYAYAHSMRHKQEKLKALALGPVILHHWQK